MIRHMRAAAVGISIGFAQAPPADPPGRLIDVGGYRLHLRCTGAGTPTVVIDGGAGTWSAHYAHIHDAVATKTRVCTYDRAGLGWSDSGPAPRNSSRMADELHSLLHAAGIVPPVILVGYSLGGYNVRIYQSRHPEEVSAVVLVEAAHPDQWSRLPREVEQLARSGPDMFRARAEDARRGTLTRALVEHDVPDALLASSREALIAAYLTPRTYLTMADEFDAAFVGGRDVPRARLGSVPLFVLSARNSYRDFEGTGVPVDRANREWLALQRELASLSTDVSHLFSDGTHSLHYSDPDAFSNVIAKAVEAVRRARMPPPALGLRSGVLPTRSTPETDDLLALGTPGRNREYRYSGLAQLRVQGGRIREQILYGDVDRLRDQIGGDR